MARRQHLCLFYTLCLIGHAFCIPASIRPRGFGDNEVDSGTSGVTDLAVEGSAKNTMDGQESVMVRRETDDNDVDSSESAPKPGLATPDPFDDDDDEDFDPVPAAPAGGGGSNIFSILKLAGALFPSSSGGGNTQGTKDLGDETRSASPLSTLKMDIFRALLQFVTSLLGVASSSSSSSSIG